MPSLITAIARELRRLDHAAQRDAFGRIMAFLRYQTGEDVPSLADFIAGRAAPGLNLQTREHLLSQIASALRTGDHSTLQPPNT